MYKLIISVFFLINLNLNAQNIDETVILADKMFEKSEYTVSLELYKRAIFFSTENKRDLFTKCGDCYFLQQDYKNALNFYDSAISYSINVEMLIDIHFKKADCLIFSEKYIKAEEIVLSIDSFQHDEQKQKKNFYLGLIYFVNTDFEKSEQSFILAVNDTSIKCKSDIHEIFQHKRYFKKPNPKIAGILSLILPGSGQLYAEDYKNAINSFLLTAVFAAVGADMYIRYAWYDSLISIFPWFYRYYNGGYKNAMTIAEQKRTEKRNEKLNELINLVEKEKRSY